MKAGNKWGFKNVDTSKNIRMDSNGSINGHANFYGWE